jgi:archaetidylinositol phosphate synthase
MPGLKNKTRPTNDKTRPTNDKTRPTNDKTRPTNDKTRREPINRPFAHYELETIEMADHVHIREHRSVLAAAEKRLLIWMARRMPLWVNSDHLTALALAAMAVAGAGYWLMRWDVSAAWLVVVALAVNWFGDSLDGTLARVRAAERPRYGYYVDHVLDIVGTAMLLGGLACSGYMNPVIALSVLVAYLLVTGEVFLATTTRGVFKMSSFGVGPTELRILIAIGTIALRGNPQVPLGPFGQMPLFDFGGLVAIVGLVISLCVAVFQNARALAKLEPRKTTPTGTEALTSVPAPCRLSL